MLVSSLRNIPSRPHNLRPLVSSLDRLFPRLKHYAPKSLPPNPGYLGVTPQDTTSHKPCLLLPVHLSPICLRYYSSGPSKPIQNLDWIVNSEGESNSIPVPPNITDFTNQLEGAKEIARTWVSSFSEGGGIPKKEFEIGYSRSSGPGGQHVNKTSTKATVRLPLKCRWVPQWARSSLRVLPSFYVDRTDSLQTSSDVHRSQSQNLAECLKKINNQIENAAMNAIPKPPDLEKQQRVAKHEARFERANKELKQRAKTIKQGRGKVRPE